MINSVKEALKDVYAVEIQIGMPLYQDKNIVSFKYKDDKHYNFYISGLEELQNTDEGLKELILARYKETING